MKNKFLYIIIFVLALTITPVAAYTPTTTSGVISVQVKDPSTNTQVYQYGYSLLPNHQYQIIIGAWSKNGGLVQAAVHKHDVPYTNYGLVWNFKTTTTPTYYTRMFTTGSQTSNPRVRITLASADTYVIDSVKITDGTWYPVQNYDFKQSYAYWNVYSNGITVWK